MSPSPFLSLHRATGYCPPYCPALTDIRRPPGLTLDGHPPAFSLQSHQLRYHQADTHPQTSSPTRAKESSLVDPEFPHTHTVSSTSASCQRGPNGDASPRIGTYMRLERQIASKVIDRTPRDGGEPVQLQSLLSPQEISHGQSELERWRSPLETCERVLHSIFAKKKCKKKKDRQK